MGTFIYADYGEAEKSKIQVDGKPAEVLQLIAGIVGSFSKWLEF